MSDSNPGILAIDGASCTIYRDGPSWDGKRTTAIGNFDCATAESGTALLAKAADELRVEGFDAVIGPMDGDTWHKYRLVSHSDGSAPYFLEPVSGLHDFAAFRDAGFVAISSYVSARAKISETIGAPAPQVANVSISAWDGKNAGALIGGLFELSCSAFTNSAFYKPIAREAFLKLYEPILPAIDPRLVFFARAHDLLVGYLFALPDRLQGDRPTTVILKTYASSVRGVGHMLVDTANRAFRDLGYSDVVHALMRVDNQSCDRSARHHGAIFRRYDLMGLDLRRGA